MIYKEDYSGVTRFENNLSESMDTTIGYHVGYERKVVTFRYTTLPEELMDELALVTNKIARFINERDADESN